ncbi:hypothetical protein N9451_00125 [bacterium]|nr:hypothetical protein [bacterium]
MKIIKYGLLVIISTYLLGCASGAQMENMVFQGEQKPYSAELNNNVVVDEVTGGKKTNPAWTSEIDNESFFGAVVGSLKSQGLYSDTGKYRLIVKMLKVEQPLFGLNLEVTTHVRYIVMRKSNNEVVFDDTIITPHTAGFDDAFAAVKRLRLANEGSANKNIEGLLEKLSQLNISANQISTSP